MYTYINNYVCYTFPPTDGSPQSNTVIVGVVVAVVGVAVGAVVFAVVVWWRSKKKGERGKYSVQNAPGSVWVFSSDRARIYKKDGRGHKLCHCIYTTAYNKTRYPQ